MARGEKFSKVCASLNIFIYSKFLVYYRFRVVFLILNTYVAEALLAYRGLVFKWIRKEPKK